MVQESDTSNSYSEFSRLRYAPYYDLYINSTFFRPKLKIEHNQREKNTFSPEQQIISESTYSQRYLRLRVRNNGRRTAHKCEAELTVILPNNADENELMRYPSDEPKLLAWGRYPQAQDLMTSIDIPAKAGRFLHIVFSDSDFSRREFPKTPKRYASVSIFGLLHGKTRGANWPTNLVVPHSFTNGRFIVEVAITSEDGVYVKARFQIDVDSDWKKLRMERITRAIRLRHFISHFYSRLIRRPASMPEPNR